MSVENYNLNEGPITMYLYDMETPLTPNTDPIITETPITVERWRGTIGSEPVDYYIPTADVDVVNRSRFIPCTLNELGTIYHRTSMLLDRQDKSYYISKLVEEYLRRAHQATEAATTFNMYARRLQQFQN